MNRLRSSALQDESYDHGTCAFYRTKHSVFDVRTRGGRRRGQEEGFAHNVMVWYVMLCYFMYVCMLCCVVLCMYVCYVI